MNLHTYQIVQYSTACDSLLPAAVFGSTAAGLAQAATVLARQS